MKKRRIRSTPGYVVAERGGNSTSASFPPEILITEMFFGTLAKHVMEEMTEEDIEEQIDEELQDELLRIREGIVYIPEMGDYLWGANAGPFTITQALLDALLVHSSVSDDYLCESCHVASYEPDDDHVSQRYVLELSTAHMPESAPDFGEHDVYRRAHGYMLVVMLGLAEDGDEAVIAHINESPEWLRPILRRAFDLGVSYVELDADNRRHPNLPVYDW